MMQPKILSAAIAILCVSIPLSANSDVVDHPKTPIEDSVDRVIWPLMRQFSIPGMAVGILVKGQAYVFNFGVRSKATDKPIDDHTLFETGSISKTFTATLASLAQGNGKLSLTDKASKYFPSLRGTSFDNVSLLNLGTHTSGGLPLQVPDEITNNTQLMTYFRSWKPSYAPGTLRTYSNPSIGILGMIAAKSMNDDFTALIEGKLLAGLGMKNTYLNIPSAQTGNYAQGYTTTDKPARMNPGVIAFEAYGIKTTASDKLRYIQINMGMIDIDRKLQSAIIRTHTGYYRVGEMTQDLVWEQYHYPVTLDQLLAGNSAKIIFEANPTTALDPPLEPRDDVLINKTGSTYGFAAYVAFVPENKIGIVILANKSYPIDARVTAAFQILTQVGDAPLNIWRKAPTASRAQR